MVAVAFMMTLLFSACVSTVYFGKVHAASMWNQTYGGPDDEYGYSVVETSDGGYTIAGETLSFGAGNTDVWLVKTNATGNAQWNQTYGGPSLDNGLSVVETSDGGYMVAGYTVSFGAGGADVWLIKTNATGTVQWNQTYGGPNNDVGWSVVETSDGGYAIAGRTDSYGAGGRDFWLVKTNATGNIQWNQTYGGPDDDQGVSMVETSDGGYAIIGYTYSFGAGGHDVWLVKTNATGNAQWNQTYGGPDDDYGRFVVQTTDGGYMVASFTNSSGDGGYDFWLFKTDATGTVQWNQTYGGPGDDVVRSVVETSDGGYAIVGVTDSYGSGSSDVWLVKTNATGTVQWNQTYGGLSGDEGSLVVETGDGGYAIIGYTNSFGAGMADVWLIKTDEYGVIPEAAWVILPILVIATVSILISKKKLLHKHSEV